jgi:hypothetical protein
MAGGLKELMFVLTIVATILRLNQGDRPTPEQRARKIYRGVAQPMVCVDCHSAPEPELV